MEGLLVQRWSNPQASRNHGVKRCFHCCDESSSFTSNQDAKCSDARDMQKSRCSSGQCIIHDHLIGCMFQCQGQDFSLTLVEILRQNVSSCPMLDRHYSNPWKFWNCCFPMLS